MCFVLLKCGSRDAQLRPAVAQLMAAVRSLPPLSMKTLKAAARLALPQIGCSNPRCVGVGGLNGDKMVSFCLFQFILV